MSIPFQGASGPSGHAGLRPALGQQAVSRNHPALQPALTQLEQISTEQPIFREIRRLIVRLFVDAFDLKTNKSPVVKYSVETLLAQREVRLCPSSEVSA